MVMKIDPRDLTEKQARLLEAFFAQEEQNDKDNKEPGNLRIKRYTKNVTYQVGNKKFLLTSGLTRRKKRYDRIVVLGPDQSIPLLRNRKKSTLYFKKVHFKKVGDCILVQATNDLKPQLLDQTQINKIWLKDIGFNFDEHRVLETKYNNSEIENKSIQKKNSSIISACGYTRYIYQEFDPDEDELGRGNYGIVYRSPGKLERSNGMVKYTRYAAERPLEEAHRKPHVSKIIKRQGVTRTHTLERVLNENRLWIWWDKWRDKSSQTKRHTKILYLGRDSYHNVVTVTESEMVQRKFPGIQLNDFLDKNRQKLSIEQRKLITIELLKALRKFQAVGGTHRDIKPENIMIYFNPENSAIEINIIDLGFAKRENGTDLFTFCGTPVYFSPEMCNAKKTQKNYKDIDNKADNYAMGLILREFWCGNAWVEKRKELENLKTCDPILQERAQDYLESRSSAGKVQFELNEQWKDPTEEQHMREVLEGLTEGHPTKRWSLDQALTKLGVPQMMEEKPEGDREEVYERENRDELLETIQQLQQEKLAKQLQLQELDASIRESEWNLKKCFKFAWEKAFHLTSSREEYAKMGWFQHFTGWPKDRGGFYKTGWAIISLFALPKNLLKVFIEVLPKALSDWCFYQVKQAMEDDPDMSRFKKGSVILLGGLGILTGLIHALARTVTSPITSAKAGWEISPLVGIASAAISTFALAVGFTFLAAFAIPVVVAKVATVLGVGTAGTGASVSTGLGSLSSIPGLSQMAAPVVFLLKGCGMAVSAVVEGAAAVSSCVAGVLGVLGVFGVGVAKVMKDRKGKNNNKIAPPVEEVVFSKNEANSEAKSENQQRMSSTVSSTAGMLKNSFPPPAAEPHLKQSNDPLMVGGSRRGGFVSSVVSHQRESQPRQDVVVVAPGKRTLSSSKLH